MDSFHIALLGTILWNINLLPKSRAVFHSNINDVSFSPIIFIDEIDELNSRWGHSETCDNFYYLPLISAIVAIVWVVLIFISGYRGESTAET